MLTDRGMNCHNRFRVTAFERVVRRLAECTGEKAPVQMNENCLGTIKGQMTFKLQRTIHVEGFFFVVIS